MYIPLLVMAAEEGYLRKYRNIERIILSFVLQIKFQIYTFNMA